MAHQPVTVTPCGKNTLMQRHDPDQQQRHCSTHACKLTIDAHHPQQQEDTAENLKNLWRLKLLQSKCCNSRISHKTDH